MSTKNYKAHLLECLKNPEEAKPYLAAAKRDPDPEVYQLALQDVSTATIPKISRDIGDNPRKVPKK